jgi:cysteine-rich repeat protein
VTTGDGCDAACSVEAGYACAGTPSVCATVCGDGVPAVTEACDDGNVTAGDGCSAVCAVEAGFSCTGTPSTCATTCGDGFPAGTETCDDGNVTAGDGCDAACAVETGYSCSGTPSVCATVCGDGTMAGTEACDDGNTTDGDCCSSACAIEAGCESEPNDACGTADGPLAAPTGFIGAISPAGDVDFFAFTLTTRSSVRVETFTGSTPGACTAADTVIELRGTDCTTVLGSDDDDGINACSLINPATDAFARTLPAGTYYVRARAFSATATIASYNVQITVTSVCPNGTPEVGEGCDDGNVSAGDGCSAACAIETGYLCSGTPSVCTLACGNGAINTGETCDDGNRTAGDGCSAVCAIETGYLCSGTPSVCTLACGNGAINTGETCDDGNRTAGDGCSAVCAVEIGYVCTGTPSVCVPAACGNGVLEGSEECDDGNAAAGDGCGSTCLVEAGYQCTTPGPSTCTLGERNCNDGGDNDGDGSADVADSDCALPAYFTACGAGQTLWVYRSVNVPRAIPDSTAAGITSPVVATGGGTVARLAVLYSIAHTWDSDLDIFLLTPSATALDVCSDNGGSGDNFTSTVVDSTCAVAVTGGTAPFSGCYQPETTFATFVGSPLGRSWALRVADDAGGDTGSVQSWALAVCVTP